MTPIKRRCQFGNPPVVVTYRLRNVLTNEDCHSLAEMARRGRKYWTKAPNCGAGTIDEMEVLLVQAGFTWFLKEGEKPEPCLDFRGRLKGALSDARE
jgi:hypothetical protein